MYACVFYRMSKNDKLKLVSVRIPLGMYNDITQISISEQSVPNFAATSRDLLREALTARKARR